MYRIRHIAMNYGKVLSRARGAAGLTQADVAALSGVARPNIAAFEADRREPRWHTAVLRVGQWVEAGLLAHLPMNSS